MRFYGNQTQAEIAARFGISQMHVSRLLSRALTWLRQAMLADAPATWQAGGPDADGHRLRLSVRQSGDRVLVEVGGEIDRDSAEQLRRAVVDAVTAGHPAEVVVDLTDVPLLDEGGIAALVAGRDAALRTGTPLRLARAQPGVRHSLTAAGLAPLYTK
jgi:RNA polymerase sigma-B factor